MLHQHVKQGSGDHDWRGLAGGDQSGLQTAAARRDLARFRFSNLSRAPSVQSTFK
ncbi:hypothetical protein LINPERHAP1_LOCUS1362 [Linum perenne]